MKYKYGMNPLTVTWAPHKYTEIGWKNFENWIHVGGLDNMLLTPNGRLQRYLTKQECTPKYNDFISSGINPNDLRIVRDDLN